MVTFYGPQRLQFSIVLVLLALLIAPRCFGQTPERPVPLSNGGTTLTLRDALNRTLDANPNLRGQRFTLNAAASRIDQVSLRPPFQVGVSAENLLGNKDYSGVNNAEFTLTLGAVVELGGKRTRRIDTASYERDLVQNQNDAERLDVLAEVARRYIKLAESQEDYDLATRRLELANSTSENVDKRVTAARSPKLEGRNAAIAANRAEIDQSQAASALRQAWAQLASMWAGDTQTSERVMADLFTMPSLDDYPPLSILLEKNPDIVRFATERRVQDAKLRLAESQRTPDVTISAGVKRFQNDRSNAFMLSASIPLGSESRAAPYVSEALSLRDGVMYREQARRAELQSTLFVALEQAKQARKETESLLKRAIPQASEAQTLAEQGYGVGRFSLLELVTAQQQLTDLQRQAINAAASFHQSLLEIEHLTGRSAADRISSNDAGSP